jgi:hypothetical protein
LGILYFFKDGFILNNDKIIAPAIIPESTERNITIARDASNFQKRKVIATGIAFCAENIATIATTINKRIIVTTAISPHINMCTFSRIKTAGTIEA